MLYYKNNEWKLPEFKVDYEQDGEKLTNYVGIEGGKWWDELLKNGTLQELKYIKLDYNQEQIGRLEEINELSIGDGFSSEISLYVIDNIFPEQPNHILTGLEVTKLRDKNKNIEEEVADIWFDNFIKEAKLEEYEEEIAAIWFEIVGGEQNV